MKKLLSTALLAIAVWAFTPLATLAQQQVSGVPIENIQPFDPTKPLLQQYCSANQLAAGTHMVEWQPTSGLAWDDPLRVTTPKCWIDCTGQVHCSTACSSAFASGCGGSGSGTVTTFSAGDFSPLFTTSVATPTTTPALTINLTNAAAFTMLANNTSASAPYQFITFDSLFGSCSGATNALIYDTGTHAFGCNTISSGGTPGTPIYSFQVNNPLGTFAGLTPASTQGKYYAGRVNTTSATAAPSETQVGSTARGVTGTTDIVVWSDVNQDIDFTNPGAVAEELPTPTTLANPGFGTAFYNENSSGVTVTPDGGWTINGLTSATILVQQTCFLQVDPVVATNWNMPCHDEAGYVAGVAVPASKGALSSNSGSAIQSATQVGDVTDAGADKTGTADSASAINSTIAAWGGGKVIFPKGTYNISSAQIVAHVSNTVIDGQGSTLVCNVAANCAQLGDASNPTAYINIVFQNFIFKPGTGSSSYSAIADNGQGSRIVNTRLSSNASNTFAHGWENDDDQSESLVHPVIQAEAVLGCNATACGSALYGPGPYATNAGITYLSDAVFNMGCSGNGIDWSNGNDLEVSGGVIQGYNEFGIRIGAPSSVIDTFQQVHIERGACSNPVGNVGFTGIISVATPIKFLGGQQSGAVPVFPAAGTPGSTYYGYYVVGKNGSGWPTNPMAAGYLENGNATVSSGNNVTVTWPDFGATTYDVLRVIITGINSPAPYGTGNFAVATALAPGTYCTAGLCTFTDTVGSPSSYTVVANGYNSYTPKISMWGGSVVLSDGASYFGDPLAFGGIFVSPGFSSVNLVGGQTAAYYQDPEPFSPLSTIYNSNLSIALGMTTYGQAPNALVLPAQAGVKGSLNFPQLGYANGYYLTFDSNPAKTASYLNARPTADAADGGLCFDNI